MILFKPKILGIRSESKRNGSTEVRGSSTPQGFLQTFLEKGEGAHSSRKFPLITKISTIRQEKVDLKPWIPRPCFNLLRLIRRVAFEEYQESSASFNVVRHIHNLSKSIRICRIVPTKILQNF